MTVNREVDDYLPKELETHNLDLLLKHSGLMESLKSKKDLFAVYAGIVDAWGTELRYAADGPRKSDTEKLYRQMEQVYGWINEQI